MLRHSLDGRALTGSEADLLLSELNNLPRGREAENTLLVVRRAVTDGVELALTHSQAETLERALEGIRRRRLAFALPVGLAELRRQLQGH
jgi:hypothetical protein